LAFEEERREEACEKSRIQVEHITATDVDEGNAFGFDEVNCTVAIEDHVEVPFRFRPVALRINAVVEKLLGEADEKHAALEVS
jgi:hypothetical protein